MKRVMLFAVMLLLIWSLSANAAEKREQTYVVGADVNVEGRVTATQFDPDVPAPFIALLSAAVKQWQFVPATLNGRQVPAHTFIETRLQAVPDANGKYDLRISFMGNGPRLDQPIQPRYPSQEIRMNHGAALILEAIAQPDGRLTDMTVTGKPADLPGLVFFRRAVLEAARHWHTTPERVNGQAVATHLRIPMSFTIHRMDMQERARTVRRNTAAANAVAESAAPITSDTVVALDSPLRPSTVATIISAP